MGFFQATFSRPPLLQDPTKFTYMKTEFGHLRMWVPLPLSVLMPTSYL